MNERDRTRTYERAMGWRRLASAAALTTLAACTGAIGETHGMGGSGSTGTSTGTGITTSTGTGITTSTGTGITTSTGASMPPPANYQPQTAGLRRLTLPQYENSVHDVLGAAVNVTTDFEADTSLSGFASIGAATIGLSAHIVEQFETSALDIAKQALGNAATRAALASCTPAGVTDATCSKQFIQKIGRRAWRRAMTDDEVTRYTAVATNAQMVVNDFFGGLQYAVAGILQSPHFLYREEIGTQDPSDATRVVFDDTELATRLSYFLWNSTPDDALLDAAAAQQITQGGGLITQATRLMASPRLPLAMQNFFNELYRLDDLDSLSLLTTSFPQMTPTLGAAMRTETLMMVNDILFTKKGDFRDVFVSKTTFVNTELAKLYGLPNPGGTAFAAATLPDTGMRVGFLGQASLLARTSQPNRSSATRRGKFIQESLLCHDIPPPPPTGIPPFPEMVPGTTRVKLTAHRQSVSCNSCHQVMDPIGLALENFDGIGVFRTLDGGQPIDASGDLDGVAFNGPRELAGVIKVHPDASTCIARNVYRYAVAHVETDAERTSLDPVFKAFQDSGYRFEALLESVVKTPGFVLAAKPTN